MTRNHKVCLGGAQFGMPYSLGADGKLDRREVGSILSYAWEMGVRSIDTASAYGSSEGLLGRIGVNNWRLTSKLGAVPEGCSSVDVWVKESLTDSLRNLRVDHLHTLLLHRPDQLRSPFGDSLYSAVASLKREGLVNEIGVSTYTADEIRFSEFDFDVYQSPFNVLDREIVTSGIAADLLKKKKKLQVRSIFLQGLLLSSAHQRSPQFEYWSDLWREFRDWCSQSGVSPLQACVTYALSKAEFHSVLVGVLSLQQLQEVLDSSLSRDLDIPDFYIPDREQLLDPRRWEA